MALNLVALGVALQNQGGSGSTVFTELTVTENGVYDKPAIIGEPVFEVGEKLTFKSEIVLGTDLPKEFFDEFGPYAFFIEGQYIDPTGGIFQYTDCMIRRAMNQSTGEIAGFFILLTINARNIEFPGGGGEYSYFDAYTGGLNALEPGWYKNDGGVYTKLDTPPYIMLGEGTSFGQGNQEFNRVLFAMKDVFEGTSTPADGWNKVTVDIDASGGLCSTSENEAGGLTYAVKVGDVGEGANPLEALLDSEITEPVKIDEVDLPNTTSLRPYAFYLCKVDVGKINAPNMKKIGEYAFYNATLTNPVLPDSIEEIGRYAFCTCYNFNVEALPQNLKTISNSAFMSCPSLSLTELPDTIEAIGMEAFYGCTKLAITKLPDALKETTQSCFTDCSSIKTMTIPAGVTKVGIYSFNRCSNLSTVTFKGKPDSISGSTFVSCDKLRTINVPWAEGEVSAAPWGAANATINYNYTGE